MKLVGVALILLAAFAAVMVGFGFGKLGYFHGLLNSSKVLIGRTERVIKFVSFAMLILLVGGIYLLWGHGLVSLLT